MCDEEFHSAVPDQPEECELDVIIRFAECAIKSSTELSEAVAKEGLYL